MISWIKKYNIFTKFIIVVLVVSFVLTGSLAYNFHIQKDNMAAILTSVSIIFGFSFSAYLGFINKDSTPEYPTSVYSKKIIKFCFYIPLFTIILYTVTFVTNEFEFFNKYFLCRWLINFMTFTSLLTPSILITRL